MNKKDYTGWKDVFLFSFVQGAKAKAYYVSLIIFALIILAALPVMSFFQSREKEELGPCKIEKLIVYDDTGLGISYENALTGDRYQDTSVIGKPEVTYEEYVKKLETAEEIEEVILRVENRTPGVYTLIFVKPVKSSFDTEDFNALENDFSEFFREAKREAVEITPEQEAFINREVVSRVEFAGLDESGEIVIAPEKEVSGISMEEYAVLLVLIMVVMMIINIAGGQISTAVVTEKSSKVIEYLMINARPLALIVGKILASLLLVLVQFAVMGISYLLSLLITNSFFPNAVDVKDNTFFRFIEMLNNMTGAQIAISLLSIIFGILFFSIIAGLAGASVTKVDELQEGLKTYQFCLIAGCYVALGMCIMEMIGGVNPVLIDIICIFPLSAPFSLASNLMLGKISMLVAIVSVGLSFVVTVILFWFTANVYESMLFYNGKVLKLKDILLIAKNRKAGKEAKANE